MEGRPDHGTPSATSARATVAVAVVALLALGGVLFVTADDGRKTAPGSSDGSSAVPTSIVPVPPGPGLPSGDPEASADAAELEKQLSAIRRRAERLAKDGAPATTFRIGTFNVLGSQHTTAGGTRPTWPSWSRRAPGAVALIRSHRLDVVGLQELQADQLDYFTRALGYQAYPGRELGDRPMRGSIIFDPSVWRRAGASTFPVSTPGRPRYAPVLLLEHVATGRPVYFVNMHPPAGRDARTTAHRFAAYDRAVRVVNELRKTGLPVFVTGDMNGRSEFFCRVLPPTGMSSAGGGSTDGGCRPPARMAVDWIAATSTPRVDFTGYLRDGAPQANRISDHFLISATATIAAD